MLAARLYGPQDIRVEEVPCPGEPPPGHALIRVTTVGVCGSDLHTYRQARIGDTTLKSPLILGHEFSGIVEAVGPGCVDGYGQPLGTGVHVAADPARPCGRCELCQAGHPNLCQQIRFCGLWPDHGALCQWLHLPAENCFPLPARLDDVAGAMLEPLGVAIHAADLAKIRVGRSVAILGAGPIGLCILQMARLSGAEPIFISDRFPWRVELARRLGATVALCHGEQDVVAAVRKATGGRGVDVAIEAAWSREAVEAAAEMLVPGGRLVVVGIAEDDQLSLRHSTARRKGLTIKMARRMKHTYPRAIGLAEAGAVDLHALVSHHFPLAQANEAFALNSAYAEGVVKVVVDV